MAMESQADALNQLTGDELEGKVVASYQILLELKNIWSFWARLLWVDGLDW